MNTIFRIYWGNKFQDILLDGKSKFVIGGHAKDDVVLDGLEVKKGLIKLSKEGNKWNYQCSETLRDIESKGILSENKMIAAESGKFVFILYLADDDDLQTFEIPGTELVIGSAKDCNLSIESKQVSRHHAKLMKTSGGWKLQDLKSTNGTYVNGVRVSQADLKDGDVIDMGMCHMLINGNKISVRYSGKVRMDEPVQMSVRPYQGFGYPFEFRRSPRLRQSLEQEELELETLPSKGAPPKMNYLSVFLPPITSIGVMVMMVVMFGRSPITLFMSIPTTLIGVLMTIINYRSQKKNYNKLESLRTDTYSNYLSDITSKIEAKQEEQKALLNQTHPLMEECLSIVQKTDRRLWERRREDQDFMELRLGSGSVASKVTIKTPKMKLALEQDVQVEEIAKLAEKYKSIDGCPIVLDMAQSATAGLIGKRSETRTLVKNLIVQAATHHSYDELRIVMICDPSAWTEWSFIRWLPHSFDETRNSRYIATDRESTQIVLSRLEDEITQRASERESARGNKTTANTPYYLIICDNPQAMYSHGFMNHLMQNDPDLAMGAIFLCNGVEELPGACNVITEVKANRGVIYSRENINDRREFTIDFFRPEQYDLFARAMAPIRLDNSEKKELPTSLTFLQGFGVRKPTEIALESNWNQAAPEVTMAVPIGIRPDGDPFYFDIHEKKHGPHGIVAGTTGSGKSEMVQSWILSMALHFSPSEVSFVLIDFKGTGLILPFRKLPHLAGTISDLDGNIKRNLIALETEISRRKELFDRYGVQNISDYKRLYRSGRADEALPYLFVVIDEFAEFRVQFPEFMTVVNRIFATGRTLGVHIVLLTQKPSGVMNEKMEANTRFRWCLKVASSADSRDMLKRPDAAKITNPGRAYVLVGENELYENIQSYWSGAQYNPYADKNGSKNNKLYVVETSGKRVAYEAERTTGYRSERKEIDAIVECIDTYVREHDIARARNIWTQKLSDKIWLNDILTIAFDGEEWNSDEEQLKATIGMIDDPAAQAQYPLMLNFSADGHIAVYGAPGTGKTTLLQTTILSLALSYSPDRLQMYLMDFGAGSLMLFKDLPHMGGIARSDDGEKIVKMTQMIRAEIAKRRQLFAACGAGNYQLYNALSGETLPNIVLVVDNFAPVLSLYPELDTFFIELAREGSTYGIYWLVTANTTSGIGFRISQNIRMALALQLTDRNDYSGIVGRTNGLEPENFPGRGLAKGKVPLEFQTALPVAGSSDAECLENLRALIYLMDAKWNGERPDEIATMPETVTRRMLKGENVGIGIRYDDLKRANIDFDKNPFWMISEMNGTERYGLMSVILEQLQADAHQELVVVSDEEYVLPGDGTVRRLKNGSEFDAYLAELMPIMQERKKIQQSDENASFDPIIICITDWKKCHESINEESLKRLRLLVTLGKNQNVIIILADTAEEFLNLYYGGDLFTSKMLEQRNAVLIGDKASSHRAFRTSLSFMEQRVELEDHEAYLVLENETVKIKMMNER